MLLRNFINTIVPFPSGGGYPIRLRTTGDTYSQINPSCYVGATGNAQAGSRPYSAYHIGRTGSGLDGRSGIAVVIGKGTTPPTLDDYLLEDPITSGLTSLSSSNNLYNKVEYLLSSSVTFSETLFNGGSADIEISEVGLLSCGTGNSQGCDLLTRDVLTTPIIIKPQEAKTITVNIDFTQMSTNVATSLEE